MNTMIINKMKTIIYTLTIMCMMTISLSSCGDDDESFTIVGSWTLTQESTSGCNDPLDNSSENTSCTSTDCETVIFDGNGNITVVDIDNGITESISGTYSINGNRLFVNLINNGVSDSDTAIYSVNGSMLTLTFDQEPDGCVDTEIYTRN